MAGDGRKRRLTIRRLSENINLDEWTYLMSDTQASNTPPKAAPRKRPPPRAVTVERVEKVTPRMTRVIFGGDALASFGPPRPGGHIKLLFVPEGEEWSPSDTEAPRPPSRTYTPRRYDLERRELEVEFVHHGNGIAARWAESAKAGDPMFVAGPGGGYDLPEHCTQLVLVADDTALPAAETVLDSLPANCKVTVFGEIYDAEEERELNATADASINWLHRGPTNARPGDLLEAAVKEMSLIPDGCYFWIACEAATMRRIRDYLVDEQGLDRDRVHTRGYWKLGETNYPDHDYGKD